jgi:hypothetical protein
LAETLRQEARVNCSIALDLTAIGYGDLLYNVNDSMAHGRTRYPHERFD